MTDTAMPKTYDPKEHESRIYAIWETSGAFHAEPRPDRRPFTIMIPPPNVTGILHMGHVLNNSLQDVLIRARRMQGYEALWQPGTDHAGIATQNVIEKELRKEGKSRHDLGREAFVERVWAWREEKGNYILEQLRRLGASCDWARTRFTMEPAMSAAVTHVFVSLYDKGLVYRGTYIVNWCPRCNTVISDEEVNNAETAGHIWHIRYPLEGGGTVTVATTRPETMLGDTAVAIHPEGPKTLHLKGKTAILPFLNRKLPIIEDDYVDPEFGAGALKVTPAHDPNDFEIGKRHGLEAINIFTEDAKVNEAGGEFQGLDRFEARKRIVERLEAMGLLEKIEDHRYALGRCQRCDTIVEPRVSTQWFVNMKPLAEPALDAYRRGEVTFVPERWGKVYTNWMENIRDWPISRQLWWGHRIPVWYCDGCEKQIAARETPPACPQCGGKELRQDPDVLDTWFSSWLWPFTTLGWPQDTPELRYFYPTQWLATSPDIIFFWVARMIMAGIEFTGKVPFPTVYLHGTVRDTKGRRMSKSLGNSPDPIDLMDTYGADALRFSMVALTPLGQDIQFDAKKTELGRNFANKIWNAARFLLMNLEDYQPGSGKSEAPADLADRWILSRLDRVTAEVSRGLDEDRFGETAWLLYDFLWKEVCDWYLELAKVRLYGTDKAARRAAQATALEVFGTSLALLHPFLPYLTEVIWSYLPGRGTSGELLIRAPWPKPGGREDDGAEREIAVLRTAVTCIRNIRADMNVPPGSEVRVLVKGAGEPAAMLSRNEPSLRALARVGALSISANTAKPPHSASAVAEGMEIYIPLEGLVDLEAEKKRLEKKRADLEKGLATVVAKLSNQDFIARAPAEVVQAEAERKERLAADLAAVERNLASLGEGS
jgi:valyl-tRNA synthetase